MCEHAQLIDAGAQSTKSTRSGTELDEGAREQASLENRQRGVLASASILVSGSRSARDTGRFGIGVVLEGAATLGGPDNEISCRNADGLRRVCCAGDELPARAGGIAPCGAAIAIKARVCTPTTHAHAPASLGRASTPSLPSSIRPSPSRARLNPHPSRAAHLAQEDKRLRAGPSPRRVHCNERARYSPPAPPRFLAAVHRTLARCNPRVLHPIAYTAHAGWSRAGQGRSAGGEGCRSRNGDYDEQDREYGGRGAERGTSAGRARGTRRPRSVAEEKG
ncbi:hypothetical protein DFH09DRAFT_1423815 [Mycena vulgaris]|nr:hypothetical protein DFH09DRAFT_1423815 [Mycena vulgaris]